MPHRTTTITTMLLLGAMLTGGSTAPGPTGAGVQESPTPPLGRGRERVYDYTVRVTVGDPTHVNGFNNLATRAMTCEATMSRRLRAEPRPRTSSPPRCPSAQAA